MPNEKSGEGNGLSGIVRDDESVDPRLSDRARSKMWLNARTAFARRVIRHLRGKGKNIPKRIGECGTAFVLACASPFRRKNAVSFNEMVAMVMTINGAFECGRHCCNGHVGELLKQAAAA